MPTKRRRVQRAGAKLGFCERLHLTRGDCMLTCALCGREVVPSWGGGCFNLIDVERARHAWATHRDGLLAEWDQPFPPFASILFDGAQLGPRNRRWPEDTRDEHMMLAAALDEHRKHGIVPAG